MFLSLVGAKYFLFCCVPNLWIWFDHRVVSFTFTKKTTTSVLGGDEDGHRRTPQAEEKPQSHRALGSAADVPGLLTPEELNASRETCL